MKGSIDSIEDMPLISNKDTLHEALSRLDATAGKGILLLVHDNGSLIRTVTDGDIRRLLLAGYSLSDTLDALPEKLAVMAHKDSTEAELLDAMNVNGVNQVVIVNSKDKPQFIAYREKVDTSILLSTPHMGEEERSFVAQAFTTNWIAPIGPNVDAFEKELAEKVGSKYAVALSSGTAALHLALRVLNVGAGDIVFCSSFTFVASANPIIYQGATPVFIDSEPESWNMSPQALERALVDAHKIGALPKAVIVVSLYGQSADIDPIIALCDRYKVVVIEDAAESLGATYKDKASGTLGKVGIYSFNGNKIITTSGGGMLVTEDEGLAEEAKFLSTQAREPAVWYEHQKIGYNYRMSNILAGVGRGQLKVLDDRVNERRAVFERYNELLKHCPPVRWMPEAGFGRSTRWLSALTIQAEENVDIKAVVKKMAEENIEVRPLWKPMHRQPIFSNAKYYPHDPAFSLSDTLFAQGLCLPSGSNLTKKQLERVAENLLIILEEL